MTAKNDRKALLRSSIKNEVESVERRFPAADVDQRYAAADLALDGRPLGLVGPHEPTMHQGRDLRAEIGAAGPARQVRRIPLSMAHDNPFNARQIYDAGTVKSLAASIATRGQLVPAPAVADPKRPGHVILIDGHYRKRALQAANKAEIDVVMHEIDSEIEMYRVSFMINEERNAQSPLDNALAWEKLLREKKVVDGEGIAEMLGISPALVAKTLAFLKLPEAAVAKLREHPAKFGAAVGYAVYRCSKSMSEPALLQLMDRVVAEDLSSRAIEGLRAKLEDTSRKPKEVSRQYKIFSDKTQIGFIKEWDSGKLTFEVHLDDAHERQALLETLKARFKPAEPA